MPYMQVVSPELSLEKKRLIAEKLTQAAVKALGSPYKTKDTCTVHFQPFRMEDMAVGGQLAHDSRDPDYHLLFTDHHLTPDRRKALAATLTPLLAKLLGLPKERQDKVNIKFTDYDWADFAIGGRFLPEIARGKAASGLRRWLYIGLAIAGLVWLARAAADGDICD